MDVMHANLNVLQKLISGHISLLDDINCLKKIGDIQHNILHLSLLPHLDYGKTVGLDTKNVKFLEI